MIRTILALSFIAALAGQVEAQPGPPPSPWSYGASLSIFYNNGEIDIGTPTGAGTLGPGWFNASGGYAINGVALPGSFGSQSANLVYASPNGGAGTPTFRPIANGDLPSNFAIPGTLAVTGATFLVNAAVSGSLSVAGPVSGAGFSTYLASPPCIGCAAPAPGYFTSLSATLPFPTISVNGLSNLSTYSVGAPGLVGDGTTINNTAFQTALTAVAGGGFIHLPCGVFKLTTGMSVTVASGAHITLEGSGVCTKIAVVGLTSGEALMFNYTDDTSSVDIKNLWMTTDHAGVVTAIGEMLTANNTLEAYSAPNVIENVMLTGSDYPSPTGAKYWGLGLNLSNTGNTSITNYTFVGGACSANICNGNGIQLTGNGTTYGVVFNIVNSNINLGGSGIVYGDFVQGVSISNTNFTGDQYAVFLSANPVGTQDGLAISNSQIECFVTCLSLNAGTGTLANVYISNVIILPGSSSVIGILLGREIVYSIVGTQFNPTGATAIDIAASSTNGNISGNPITGWTTGILTAASTVNTGTIIANNPMAGNTANYSIGAGSSGYVIKDPNKSTIAGLFTCIAGIGGSMAYVHDTLGAAAPTYHLTVAASGSTTVDSPVYCNQTVPAWQYD